IVSVIGVTFISFSLFFGAILLVLYVGWFKSFLDNLKEEIAQTHREYHPWPVGSARWHLQRMIRNRGHFPESQRPNVSSERTQYQNLPSYHPTMHEAQELPNKIPIIVTDYSQPYPQQIISIPAENHVTYFTPTPPSEMPKTSEVPICDFQEYKLIREESLMSRGSAEGMYPPLEDVIIRTTTTRHSQTRLRPATFI
uniref:Uncharacterized protein n=1 Tax=Acrobeloides nanus TaxID=290746 RepID=A0A914DC26_9BILA